MNDISRLQRVPLREIWPHEALDFTRWLQQNLDILNDELGLSLTGAEREKTAGDFSVDLVADDGSESPVIIENQLGRSDHDHLGKLITYMSVIGADTAIWIVAEPRAEHISAVSWLNESSSGHFYLVKVEAVRISNSPPAPLLTLIVGPSDSVQETSETKREFSERHELRRKYWAGLLERARHRTTLHSTISPSNDSWIQASSGIRGLNFVYHILQHGGRVEFHIDRGTEAHEENKAIFEKLLESRSEIDTAFEDLLEWDYKEGRRGCKISKGITLGGYRDENWEESQEALISAMIKLEKALSPHIPNLKLVK